MQFQPPVNGNLADPNRPYVNPQPENGIEGSIPPASAIEHPMREILNVITGAGLEPSGENLAQMFQAIQVMIAAAVADKTLPVGSILPCPSTTPLPGTYLADGSMLTREDDPDLWAYAIGSGNIVDEVAWTLETSGSFSRGDGATTFRLPDLRGVALRGFDGGRGLDVGRIFGSLQKDQMQQLLGTLGFRITDATNPLVIQPITGVFSSTLITGSNNNRVSLGESLETSRTEVGFNSGNSPGARVGNETRMTNTAYSFCIKY